MIASIGDQCGSVHSALDTVRNVFVSRVSTSPLQGADLGNCICLMAGEAIGAALELSMY
jgi:hypothetical protein